MTQRPQPEEHSEYHLPFISKVPDGDLLALLEAQSASFGDFLRSLPASEWTVVHKPYGWTVQQVVEHCLDAERVFGYRMLRFATGDTTDLPGWDENDFAAAGYGPANAERLAAEFEATRQSNLCLLRRIEPARWDNMGVADGRRLSVRAIAFLMAGHLIHHQEILKTRLAG